MLVGLPLVLAAVALAVLLWLLPAATPTVTADKAIEPRDVERALYLARLHDPRRAIPGVVRTLRLTQHEAELLINHAAVRVRPGRWALQIDAGRARLQGSVRPGGLFEGPWGAWVNVDLLMRQTHGLPQLEAVRIGRLDLPVPLVEWLFDRVARHYGLGGGRLLAAAMVQQVRLAPRRLDVVYAWTPDAPVRLVASLLPPQDHERLRLYATRLVDTAQALPAGPLSLAQLMPPMFELARQRSAQGGDAVLENRSALLVLGMAANGIGLSALLPERRAELLARPIRLTLAGRRDSTQHFLVSAALAADSGSPLADLIGLYKEINDARFGSGFSFNDMAANRAGTRLGELAVGDPAKLQQRLAAELHEEDLLPDVSDLPEGMSTRELQRRFGGPGTPEFERMMNDIEGRLDATPLYR